MRIYVNGDQREIEPESLASALNALGFASGAPDGMMGPATRAGLRGYQRSVGLPADGYPTLDLLQRVQTR